MMEAQLMADAEGITERLERVQLPLSMREWILGRSETEQGEEYASWG